jgi:hypothetical protein
MMEKKLPEELREGEEVLYTASVSWRMLVPWLAASVLFFLMGTPTSTLILAPAIAALAWMFYSSSEILVTSARVMKRREGRYDMRPDPDTPRPTRGRYIEGATPEIPIQRGFPGAFKIVEIEDMDLGEIRDARLAWGWLKVVRLVGKEDRKLFFWWVRNPGAFLEAIELARQARVDGESTS